MIRVFVGTEEMHHQAEKVLEWSIRKNTTEEIDIVFMRHVVPWQTPPTGFSSHRYMIPRLCNHSGYAIYLDVDMLVLADIKELWNYRTPGKWCVTQTKGKQGIRDEVSVIDCSAFDDLPDETTLMTRRGKTIAKHTIGNRYLTNIPPEWNATILSECAMVCPNNDPNCTPKNPTKVPSFAPSPAKLIHYTNLDTQPWHPDPNVNYQPFPCNKTKDLFFEYLEEANREL